MADATARRVTVVLVLACGLGLAQGGLESPDPAERIKAVGELRSSGDAYLHLDALSGMLSDASGPVRRAAIEALIDLGGDQVRPPLAVATRDPLPDLQIMAVEGLVDTYVPDYVRTGRLAAVKSMTSSLRSRLSNPTPVVVPAYVTVDGEVARAIGAVVREGRNPDARATAARALGVLRAGQEREALLAGIRSRDPSVVIQSTVAFKKIGDPSVGDDLVFLLRDPERSVQEAACEALGQLRTVVAIPALIRVIQEAKRATTRAKALEALAKIPDKGGRDRFLQYLEHRDKMMRRAAAEGLGRIGDPADRARVSQRLSREKAGSARLALAFAAVRLGDSAPLEHLLRGLNSAVHRFEARALLEELARDAAVREKLYSPLLSGTNDQRQHLAHVMGVSGSEDSLPHLETLVDDSRPDVALAAIEAVRLLRARL